jgi:hypothetical protein
VPSSAAATLRRENAHRPGGADAFCPVECLRIQVLLVYVNTLMIQDLIDDPDTGEVLVTAADKRGVTHCSGNTSCLTARSGSTWAAGSPSAVLIVESYRPLDVA